MEIRFSKKAQEDIKYFKTTGNKSLMNKISNLLNEIEEHYKTGTGKPELLKGDLSGCYSRRINGEHRIIYENVDDKIYIHSLKGHYDL